MSYGQSLGLTLPVVGVDTFAVGATRVNTALQALIDCLETKVNPSGMDINTNLSFKSGANSYAAIDLLKTAYTPGGALAAAIHPASLYFRTSDGEFYANDNNGNVVKMTAAGSVNAPVGNVTGAGYGSGGVEVNWDSGNTAYRMRSGTATHDYADVVINHLRMDDGDSNELTLVTPNLTGDVSVTLPTAPASGESLLKMSNTGVITASDAITPSSGTLAITGAVTATGNVTAADNRHTADRVLTLGTYDAKWFDTQAGVLKIATTSGDHQIVRLQDNAEEIIWNIPLPAGTFIKSITISYNSSASAGNKTLVFASGSPGVGGFSAIDSNTTTENSGTWQTLTIASIDHTMVSGDGYVIQFNTSGTITQVDVDMVQITYTRP